MKNEPFNGNELQWMKNDSFNRNKFKCRKASISMETNPKDKKKNDFFSIGTNSNERKGFSMVINTYERKRCPFNEKQKTQRIKT